MGQMLPTMPPPASLSALSLTESLDAIDRAESTLARVQVTAALLHGMGFDRVVISLRDASLNPIPVVRAGLPETASLTGLALKPLPGAVWRRRLSNLERFRVGDLHLLDGSDPWVSREFFGVEPQAAGDGHTWLPTDLIVALLRGSDGELLGIVKLAGPQDGRRPSEVRRRDISAITRHLAARVAYDALRALAEQRHERLLRLQEAGASLTRSLDEREIMRELTRQVQLAVRADGVAVMIPDLDADILTTALRIVRGAERARGPVRLGEGIVAEVARTGRPVRVGDRDADRTRERAGLIPPLSMYDVVGESGAATSVLAVPMRVGIRLLGVLAVHSTNADVYTAEDEEVLATMASQAATAIANARRYAESERERRTTEALADVARAVGESLRLGEVLRLILRHAVSLLGVEGACVALRTGEYLHIVASIGSADVLSGVHLPVTGSVIGRSVVSNELIVLNDGSTETALHRMVQHLAPIQRMVIAPLMTGRGTIGSIAVINRDRPFDQDDGKVLQRLADQVAVAIVNARLFEEVEKATREWKVAFDSTASGIVVLEESLTVSRCNSRAADLCGTTIPALLGRRFRDALVGSSDTIEASAVDRFISRALAEGVPTRELVRDDATGRLFSLLAAPHPDGGCVITFDDVTDSHRMAERHRKVLDTVFDAIVITDLEGRITFANPASHMLFRRPNLEGEAVTNLTPSEWIESVQAFERLAREGEGQQYECEVLRADGERRLVRVSSAPLIELGQVTGTVACLHDITERRAELRARERSESLYMRLVEAATDAICTVDLHGRFTSVNAGFLTETGLRREEVIDQHFASMVDPADRPTALAMAAETLAGHRRRQQMRFLGANGPRMGMITTAPIHEQGEVVGALGIIRDVTSEEIARESDAQQARMAAVGQSLSRVANELNNPLASLLAVAELQATSPTMLPQDRRVIEQICEQARRASRIVSQLLDSTGEAPQTAGERQRLDVNALVRRAIELHGYGRREHGIVVEFTATPDLPAISGDAIQLHQAVSNLLVNAEEALVDFDGERLIRVITREGENGVDVQVTDTGPGITSHHLARILEPMFTTRNALGHRGLGLTITHAIVRDHGGSLDVRSRAGEGAEFTLTFPVSIATPATTNETSDGENDAVAPATGSILLIEDEATLRSAISRFLRNTGYTVDVAEGGSDALDLLAERSYDLILLDLRMKGITGEQVYELIESRDSAQARRVVFMTGDLHSDAASRFIRMTGRPVLAKPFTLGELETRVAQLIQGSR
jgi:two-component system NtrC family sensor kinase